MGRPMDVELSLAYSLDLATSTTGETGFLVTGSLHTEHVFNVVQLDPGVWLDLEVARRPGIEQATWRVRIPSLGVDETRTVAGPTSSGSMAVRFMNLRLLSTFSLDALVWQLLFDAVELRLDGAVVSSLPGGSLLSTGYGPGYVPLFGLPPMLDAAAETDLVGISLPPYVWVHEAETRAEVTGGWRFRPSGSNVWTSAPIQFQETVLPAATCAHGAADTAGVITGSGCDAVTVNLRDKLRMEGEVILSEGMPRHFTRQTLWRQGGWASLVPAWSREAVRLSDDHGELVQRAGFPYTKARGERVCAVAGQFFGDRLHGLPVFGQLTSREDLVHDELSNEIEAVGDALSALESPMVAIPFAMHRAFRGEARTQYVSSLDLPGETPSRGPLTDPFEGIYGFSAATEYPYKVQDADSFRGCPDPNPDLLGSLRWVGGNWRDRDARRATYATTWLHPHWSFWLPFEDWEVDGTPASAMAYWRDLGHQWWGPRTSLVSAPLGEGALRTYLSQMPEVGQETSYWGTPDFHVLPLNPVASRPAMPGSTRWNLEDCTATWAPGVATLTSTGPTTIRADYELGSFEAEPYLYPLIAKWIEVGWSAENVASARVQLVGVDGVLATIATAPGRCAWPSQVSVTQYAGNWGQDFGLGLVDDTGADTQAAGRSALAMADPEQVMELQLLGCRTAKALRFEFTLVEPGEPITLQLPNFFADGPPEVFTENRQTAALLWKVGPGLRWGQQTLASALTNDPVWPPVVRPMGLQTSALDFLYWRRIVFEGVAPLTGIDAEISGLYRTGEEYLQRKHLAEDTQSWMTRHGAVLVNSWVGPPLAFFPAPDRGLDLRPLPNAWANKVWTLAEKRRRLVTPVGSGTVALRAPSGADILTDEPAPIGWRIRSHTLPVTNSEFHWEIFSGGQVRAHIRPFHGFLGVLPGFPPAPSSQRGLDSVIGPRGSFSRVHVDESGTIQFRGQGLGAPLNGFEVASTVAAPGPGETLASPAVVQDGRLGLSVIYERSGAVRERRSHDDGRTWKEETEVFSNGKRPQAWVGRIGEVRAAFRHAAGDEGSGTLHLRYRTHGQPIFAAEVTVQDSSGSPLVVADDAFSLVQGQGGPEWWILSCRVDGETEPSEWICAHEGEWQFKRVN